MVLDIESVHQGNTCLPSNFVAKPTYQICGNAQSSRLWTVTQGLIQRDSLADLIGEQAFAAFNHTMECLMDYSDRIIRIDSQTEKITKPLKIYSNGIVFRELGEAGLYANDHERTLSLNLAVAKRLAKHIPNCSELALALTILTLHEVSHISQGLKDHKDVQRMKRICLRRGRQRMGELDLNSDFLANHALSLLLTLAEHGNYNEKIYVQSAYKLWCQVCKSMLKAFPPPHRKDQSQRVFGYLLMSNCVEAAYMRGSPLRFNAALWPDWNSISLGQLTIYSDGAPLVLAHEVDPTLMKITLRQIRRAKYDDALSTLRKICSHVAWP